MKYITLMQKRNWLL